MPLCNIFVLQIRFATTAQENRYCRLKTHILFLIYFVIFKMAIAEFKDCGSNTSYPLLRYHVIIQ